jgi:hypothetical protein
MELKLAAPIISEYPVWPQLTSWRQQKDQHSTYGHTLHSAPEQYIFLKIGVEMRCNQLCALCGTVIWAII